MSIVKTVFIEKKRKMKQAFWQGTLKGSRIWVSVLPYFKAQHNF